MADEGEDVTRAQGVEEGEDDGEEANGELDEEEAGRRVEEVTEEAPEEKGRDGGGEGEEEAEEGDLIDIFPRARVRKIMRIDPEINKMTSESLTLVSLSTVLFLRHLAEASAEVTVRRKKRIVRLEHFRDAVRNHRPTRDFLLDCLHLPATETATEKPKERPRAIEKPAPPGNRRIDDFFRRG
ncbi:unnamed protein product [Victoria cruziana]